MPFSGHVLIVNIVCTRFLVLLLLESLRQEHTYGMPDLQVDLHLKYNVIIFLYFLL